MGISNLDEWIGSVLESLERSNLDDETKQKISQLREQWPRATKELRSMSYRSRNRAPESWPLTQA